MTGSETTATDSNGRFPQMGRGRRVVTVLVGVVILGWLISWATDASPERAALILHLALGGVSATASLIGGRLLSKRPQSAIFQGLGITDVADRVSAFLAGVASFVELVTAGLAGSLARAFAAPPGGNVLIVRRSRLILLPVTVAAFAALLLWLVVARVTETADMRIFFALFVANVWARQVRNLIGLSSLPAMLRQAPRSPQLAFIVIMVSDVVTLLISLAVLTHWPLASTFSWSAFVDLLPGVLATGNISTVLESLQQSPLELLTLASGTLLATTMLKQAFKRQDFRRTADDHAALAAAAIGAEDIDAADHWLSLTAEDTLEAIPVRSAFYIATERFDRYRIFISERAAKLGIPEDRDTPFMMLPDMLHLVPVDHGLAARLLHDMIAENASDKALSATLLMLIKIKRLGAARLADDLSGSLGKYPFAQVSLLIHGGRHVDARDALYRLRPKTAFDAALKHCLLMFAKMGAVEDRKAGFDDWAANDWPQLTKELGRLDEIDVREKKVLIRELKDVEAFARQFGSDIAEPARSAHVRLNRSLDPDLGKALHGAITRRMTGR